MNARVTCFCSAVALLSMMGCTTHFGVQDKAINYPDEFEQTEAAIAKAENQTGAAYCTEKIAKAKELGKKGVETYWACRDKEALALLEEARKLAESCRPPASAAPAKGVTVKTLYFDFAKSNFKPQADATLDEVVKMLKENPNARVELSGHTDMTGTDAANQKLSEERVQTVKRYLTSKGISESRIQAAAFGETKPASDNNTEQGRAQNRRVEIRISK